MNIEKKVLNVKHMEDGVSVINVVITLKNRSFKEIKNIKVSDTIQNHVDDPYFAGLRPSINRKTKGRQNLLWLIPAIEARGEIVQKIIKVR